jgi:hypothetical protein
LWKDPTLRPEAETKATPGCRINLHPLQFVVAESIFELKD